MYAKKQMEKLKKITRVYVVPLVALGGALWLWRHYGNEDVWWWPLAIAITLAVELRLYLQKRRRNRQIEGHEVPLG